MTVYMKRVHTCVCVCVCVCVSVLEYEAGLNLLYENLLDIRAINNSGIGKGVAMFHVLC